MLLPEQRWPGQLLHEAVEDVIFNSKTCLYYIVLSTKNLEEYEIPTTTTEDNAQSNYPA